MLDGAIRLSHLIDHCVENSIDTIAVTDNAVMYGVVDFYLKAKDKGIKLSSVVRYIYVTILALQRDTTRLILLATSYEGYTSLSEIVSVSHLKDLLPAACRLIGSTQFSKDIIAIAPGGRGLYAGTSKQ